MGFFVVISENVSVDGDDFMTTCPSAGNGPAGAFPGAATEVHRLVNALTITRRRYIVRTADGCNYYYAYCVEAMLPSILPPPGDESDVFPR